MVPWISAKYEIIRVESVLLVSYKFTTLSNGLKWGPLDPIRPDVSGVGPKILPFWGGGAEIYVQ